MPITITIDNDAVANGETYVMPDAVVESGISPSTIRLFVSAGTTLQSVSSASWGRGVSVDSDSLPVTFVTPDVHELPITPASRRGDIHDGDYIGAYWQEFTINYDEGGPDLEFTFRVVGRIGTTGGQEIEMSFEDFRRNKLIQYWNVGANSASDQNPLGLGWGASNGHMNFATTNPGPSIEEGVYQQFIWTPFGRTQEYTGDTDFQFDQFVESEELYPEQGIWRDEWFDAMEYLFSLNPNVRIFVYMGTLRGDNNYIEQRSGENARSFIERFFKSLKPILRYPRLELCLDVPYRASSTEDNPRIEPGEARYEAQDMIRKLLALQGRKVYCEPRHPTSETHWNSDNGWDRVMVDRSWWRSNPEWYSDATSSSDSVLGKNLVWINSGNDSTNISYYIADLLHNEVIPIVFVRSWFDGGGTIETLYDEVMGHLQFIRTGVAP